MSYSFPPSQQRRPDGDENPIGKTLRYAILGISDYTAREGYLCRYSVEHFLERRPEAIISFPTIGRHLKWNLVGKVSGNYDGYLRLRSPGC